MAGASNAERTFSYVSEATFGTTPATPSFTNTPFREVTLDIIERVTDSNLIANGGRRSAISRAGYDISGVMRGEFFYEEHGPTGRFWESLYQDAWAANIVIDNVNEQYGFTVEENTPEGAGGAATYRRAQGCAITNCRLTFTDGQPIEVEWSYVGSTATITDTAIITGATYTDPSNTNALGSNADVGFLTLGALGTADCYQTATIDFNMQDVARQGQVGSDNACGIRRGRIAPIITTQFYVEDLFKEILDAGPAGTQFAMTFPIGSVTTEKYLIEFPVCEIVRASLPGGVDGDAFVNVEIRALYDSAGIGGVSRLTRAVA